MVEESVVDEVDGGSQCVHCHGVDDVRIVPADAEERAAVRQDVEDDEK